MQKNGLPPGSNVGTQLKALRQKNKQAVSKTKQKTTQSVSQKNQAGIKLQDLNEGCLQAWFEKKNWQPLDFQRQTWLALKKGHSGLVHSNTGTGKTLAVYAGSLLRCAGRSAQQHTALNVLWVTPMRALACDTANALLQIHDSLAIDQDVGCLMGDTSQALRSKYQKTPPFTLVTTPESLTLMLTRPKALESLQNLQVLVVDEWHELVGNKRGVQLQLAIARLVRMNPAIQIWGISATLGNLDLALHTLLMPLQKTPSMIESGHNINQTILIKGTFNKPLVIDSIIPENMECFPWAGHLGLRLIHQVIAEVDKSTSILLFTNTRAQAENWFQSLLAARPDFAGVIALHHGSLDAAVRQYVENGLKAGTFKLVVCTSSLDLGVDFLPVERVIQVGSPKGVARLLQRAGRSGHSPSRTSRVTVVPTHALELIEVAAVRHCLETQQIESRYSPKAPMDVLVQHLVTVALGSGFEPTALYQEVITTKAYEKLTRQVFDWALTFVQQGGSSLKAYPEFERVAMDEFGVYRVLRKDIARRHLMSVGTIMANSAMTLKWSNGTRLGTIEESFIARLKIGDCFSYAGRVLELVRIRDMTAYVKPASKKRARVPSWQGGKMPLSSELANACLHLIENFHESHLSKPLVPPELSALTDLFAIQQTHSQLPSADVFLIETLKSRDGYHLFAYPFKGRMVHSGLASLWAWRLSKTSGLTFSIALNDYGFELFTAQPIDWSVYFNPAQAANNTLFDTADLSHDVLSCLNASELAQRRFREIARISGLVFQGYPGASKSTKQVQASSGLFFNVFKQFDAQNCLLKQAYQEVLEQELDIDQLTSTLNQLAAKERRWVCLQQASPFAFPLMVERLRDTVTTETLEQRVKRMVDELNKAVAC